MVLISLVILNSIEKTILKMNFEELGDALFDPIKLESLLSYKKFCEDLKVVEFSDQMKEGVL